MAEIEVNGIKYFTSKMNARQQFDVVRLLGPAMQVFQLDVVDNRVQGARWITGLLSGYMANMTKMDCDFVLDTCLAMVKRDNGTSRPAPIWVGGNLAFQDIDMLAMLELCDVVIQENLGPFFLQLKEARERADLAAADSITNQ